MSPVACPSAVVAALLIFAGVLPSTAQQGRPALSRGADSVLSNNPSDTPGQAVKRAAVTPQHSQLGAYEQCGGELGLCNTTTIGVPCGDHPWDTVALPCPPNYRCQRQTSSFWQCAPVLGKGDASNDNGPTKFTTAPLGDAPSTPAVLTPGANSSADAVNGSSSIGHDKNATPEVKACKQGEFSVGNRCFKGSPPGSGAGSRKGLSGALAGNMLVFAAWQLAAVLLMSVALLH